jgi:hypothetical protein
MKNKNVWAKHGTSLRFGRVEEEKIEGGWKFYSVGWVDDDAYAEGTKWLEKLRPGEVHAKKWYRIDEVNVFQPDKTIETLRKL